VRGQHLLELDERAQRCLLDPAHRRAGSRAQADGDRDRLVVVEQQWRHRRPRAQPVAAGRAGQRFHRIAELPKTLDVAPDRASGHLEPVGQLRALPVTASLEQRQQREKPA